MRWVVVVVLLVAAVLTPWVGATDSPARRSSAEPSVADLEKKLEDVLAKQDEILKRLDAVMEELRIVKIRCTQ